MLPTAVPTKLYEMVIVAELPTHEARGVTLKPPSQFVPEKPRGHTHDTQPSDTVPPFWQESEHRSHLGPVQPPLHLQEQSLSVVAPFLHTELGHVVGETGCTTTRP